MALSHAIARGVLKGLLTRGGTFHVTRKGAEQPGPVRPAAPQAPWFAVREEALLLAGLMLAAAALWVGSAETTAQQAAWMALLLLQSLPYAAALSCAKR